MEKNVGQADSIARVGLGAVLGLVSLLVLGGPPILSPVLGLAAVILLVTGLTSTCGLYSVLGVRTN
jgi:sorbitol-specific phosphotransferase system component IIBC